MKFSRISSDLNVDNPGVVGSGREGGDDGHGSVDEADLCISYQSQYVLSISNKS